MQKLWWEFKTITCIHMACCSNILIELAFIPLTGLSGKNVIYIFSKTLKHECVVLQIGKNIDNWLHFAREN